MGDFEFFRPGEASESYDPAAFERFRQQMQASAQAMAAIRRDEQRQKKKEDKLAAILLRLIRSNQKRGVLMLAAALLEQNIPPSFILSVIVLGNEDIYEELVKQGESPLPLLPEGAPEQTSEFALVTRFTDESVPLAVKAQIDAWGRGLFETASAVPFRMLETALDKDGKIKRVVIDCCANILGDFFALHQMRSMGYETYYSFCEFLLKGLMQRLKEQIANQRQIGSS